MAIWDQCHQYENNYLREYSMGCVSWGSLPPAEITWYRRMDNSQVIIIIVIIVVIIIEVVIVVLSLKSSPWWSPLLSKLNSIEWTFPRLSSLPLSSTSSSLPSSLTQNCYQNNFHNCPHHNLQSGFTPMVNANEEERSRSKVRKSSNIGSVPKICHQIYDDYGADDFLHGYDYWW